jgi:hypothetical protein
MINCTWVRLLLERLIIYRLIKVMEYATNVQLIDWDQDEQIFHVVNPEKHAPYPFS